MRSETSRNENDAAADSAVGPLRFAADAIVAAHYAEAMEQLAKAEADGSLPEPPGDDAAPDQLRQFGAAWQQEWGPSFVVEVERARPLIEPGRPAPPWSLRDSDGEPVSHEHYAGRHVLLVWGSLSCPTTCATIPAFESLADKWRLAGLACIFVYEREAHVGGQFGYGVVQQAFTFDDRIDHARRLGAMFGLTQTILIDEMDNKTKRAYAAQDNSAYLIDANGESF
jgi:hypothetical protein